MNKKYLEYTGKAQRFQAKSYEAEAKACRANGEDDRAETYDRLAKCANKNADDYAEMVASYDE